MAVGRWLAVTPEDAEAQTLQEEIDWQLQQSKAPTDPVKKRATASRTYMNYAKLEATMSNPHFSSDLFKLQHNW
jgi:hypothetical protein